VQFTIDNEVYQLKAGDSLIFEAHLPHTWENNQPALARLLMILAPADAAEEAGSRHVSLEK
jgi:quercetin dioxygenase-like cupin family protein